MNVEEGIWTCSSHSATHERVIAAAGALTRAAARGLGRALAVLARVGLAIVATAAAAAAVGREGAADRDGGRFQADEAAAAASSASAAVVLGAGAGSAASRDLPMVNRTRPITVRQSRSAAISAEASSGGRMPYWPSRASAVRVVVARMRG